MRLWLPHMLVLGLCAVMGGAAAAGIGLAGRWAGTTALAGTDLVWILSFLVFPLVGSLIAWQRPELALGWIFLGIGVAQSVGVFLGVSSMHLLGVGEESAAAWSSLGSNLSFWTAWTLATTFALLMFPTGTVLMPGRRLLLTISFVAFATVAMCDVIGAGPLEEDESLVSPLAVEALGEWPGRIAEGTVLALLLVTLAALVSLVVAWRQASGEARLRLMWLALGAMVAMLTAVVGAVLLPWAPDGTGTIVESLAVAALPVATGMGILRTRLFDVATVLNRTIVYAVLTGIVVLAYFTSLAIATGFHGEDASRGASLLASAAIAVFLAPVKTRLQRGVDRAIYGDRAEPYRALANLAAKLERTTALDDLIETVSHAIKRTLRVPYVHVVVGESESSSRHAEVLPLIAHGRHEGTLVVGHRPGQAAFGAAERRLLADLARQVAREVRGARLAMDLQESRDRLVRAREEERLRIRRDLHDGIGPTLAAARLQIDALSERWAPEDPVASQLLSKVRDEIAATVVDVRHVVEGLRPPALDDLGLIGVVRERLEVLQSAGLSAELECPAALEVGSAAVEVAAYRIVSESLTNVVKHACANSCRVTLAVDDGMLRIQVVDDGAGIGSGSDGVGLMSMTERASELGGTCELSRHDSGGTIVSARIPIGSAP